jgi:Golgi-body localisation protein domain
MLNDDLNDLNTVQEEIKLRQCRIRDLTERISTLQLRLAEQPSSQGRMELALIQSNLTKQADELGLIFDAVQINREKGDIKPGLWLEASSSDITWHMLDESDYLLAKLSLKGLSLTWTSNTDGSTKNQLVIKDLQALDARPDAPFSEILSKHRGWKDRNNKMIKASRNISVYEILFIYFLQTDLLLRARWKTMPPVGGISILDDFKLRFHPLRIQIDASVGQKIQDYLFPKDRRNRFHSVETLNPEGQQPESPDSPPGQPYGSSQSTSISLKPRMLVPRSASHTDLRATVESTPGPRLYRTRSTNALHNNRGNDFTEADRISLDHTLAEMRARSSENRTFVHANIRPQVFFPPSRFASHTTFIDLAFA